jgi:hypothetical protein
VPLAATSPLPWIRFTAFRFLSQLIKHSRADREHVQLMLLKDLVVDCPFESMRIAAIGILREVVIDKILPGVS